MKISKGAFCEVIEKVSFVSISCLNHHDLIFASLLTILFQSYYIEAMVVRQMYVICHAKHRMRNCALEDL